MKKFLFILVFFIINKVSLYPQAPFYDGFETGDFSKWDNIIGATISTEFKHSGIYSAKFEINSSINNKRIQKNNSPTNYIKIRYYIYLTNWYQAYAAHNVGCTGLLWLWNVWSENNAYMVNCLHQNIGTFNHYLPRNYWNEVIY